MPSPASPRIRKDRSFERSFAGRPGRRLDLDDGSSPHRPSPRLGPLGVIGAKVIGARVIGARVIGVRVVGLRVIGVSVGNIRTTGRRTR
jgi:hypothetical protein